MISPATILVVDDEAHTRTVLVNMLKLEKYQVIAASNGREGLAAAAAHRPDVMLLDVMMPDLDGYEVCRLLRADPMLLHMPVLLISSLTDRESRLHGLEQGADDFITKPFDTVELRARLRSITRLNRFRRLSEERARFEQALASAPDGIVLTDTEGAVLFANNAFCRLFEESAPPAEFFDCLPKETQGTLRGQLHGLTDATLRVGPCETTILRPRVPGTILEITAASLIWEEKAAWQFNVRDITEKKGLETQLLQAQRLELLGQLAGGIVHDVNNLLTSIMGSSQMFQLEHPDMPSNRMDAILTAAKRGAALLRKLLLFARGEDGKMVAVDPVLLVNEVAGIAEQTCGRHITLTIDLADNLPDIMADANQLHQVLMNLCVNARDAMTQGGSLRLEASLRTIGEEQVSALGPDARPGDFVVFSVHDTGTGMLPTVQARIFEPFYTTKKTGTGLGLATVLRVTRRHHGFVTVESKVGAGTSFSCYFPIAANPVPVPGGVTDSRGTKA
ncbi:MAG TPA: response regulator [Opitutaceae bacterium]|jgi:two-component system cell cycle sensor histidine kinase/response regulator CckA|nr:response regulator [Opitutaceae bacterium]